MEEFMKSSMKMYYIMKLTGKLFLVKNKNIEILVTKNELKLYFKNEGTNYDEYVLKFPYCEISLYKLILENLDKIIIHNEPIVYEINTNKLSIFNILDFLLTTINEVEFSTKSTSIECIRLETECDPINIRKFITGLKKGK